VWELHDRTDLQLLVGALVADLLIEAQNLDGKLRPVPPARRTPPSTFLLVEIERLPLLFALDPLSIIGAF
jgi:hypothetical protein